MGIRTIDLALGVMLFLQAAAAHATAYRAEGYYYFWMHIEEIGFKGEAFLEYSGRLTATQIADDSTYEGSWFMFRDVHGLKGWDRVNDGPWRRMVVPPGGFPPSVVLYVDDFCNPDVEEDCPPPDRDFLAPIGATSLEGAGQFDFFRVDGEGSYAWFDWNGAFYECDWEYECRPGPDPDDEYSSYEFARGWESSGTFAEVPEPAIPVLLSIGLFATILARRRVTPDRTNARIICSGDVRAAVLIRTMRVGSTLAGVR